MVNGYDRYCGYYECEYCALLHDALLGVCELEDMYYCPFQNEIYQARADEELER